MAEEMTQLVDAALAEHSTPDATAKVIAAGDAAIPILAGRLDAADDSQRADIIGLLAQIGTPSALEPLLPFLNADRDDTRIRAARAAYKIVMKHGKPDSPRFADAVLAGFAGKPPAATLLLAGFVPSAQQALAAHRSDTHLVKLDDAGPVVEARWAVTISLSLLGNSAARAALNESFATADAALLEFYLDAVPMLDDPTSLHALADATLSNTSPVNDGLPSGATPPRRLADKAVHVFVDRLNLQPSFALDDTVQYSEDERREIRELISTSMPQ